MLNYQRVRMSTSMWKIPMVSQKMICVFPGGFFYQTLEGIPNGNDRNLDAQPPTMENPTRCHESLGIRTSSDPIFG